MFKNYKLNIDFTELREQKDILLNGLNNGDLSEEIQGTINLIDCIQDQAVDICGVGHEEVFGTSDGD